MKRDSISGGMKSSKTYEMLEALSGRKFRSYPGYFGGGGFRVFWTGQIGAERDLSMGCWGIVMDMGSSAETLSSTGTITIRRPTGTRDGGTIYE